MGNNLHTVLSNLKSEKVKERQEGLASLRTTFGRDSLVATFDEHAC
jgi:ataxia telangiectasia mutated family protein